MRNEARSVNPENNEGRRDDDLLTEIEAREQELPMSLAWYRRQRLFKQGPPFKKIGARVFYRRAELRAWIDRHTQATGGGEGRWFPS